MYHNLMTYNDLLQSSRTVSYSSQHYDRAHSLVSFRFSPRPQSPPAIFFSRFASPVAADLAAHYPGSASGLAFHVVHDFATGVQYTVEQRWVWALQGHEFMLL